MNTGLVLLLEMVAIFAIISLMSFGKLVKWFFAPQHLRWMQKAYWIIVVIAIIITIFQW